MLCFYIAAPPTTTTTTSTSSTTTTTTTTAALKSCFLNQTTYSTGSGPYSVTVVDVNNDSKPDIVVPNEYSATVGILLNKGNGTFLNQTTYPTGSWPCTLAVVDMNSDNKPDIVVPNYWSYNIGVLLNTGNGTFLPQTTYSTGTNPTSVAVADMNGDNKPDIVYSNYNSDGVGVLLNKGNGTFLNQTTYPTGKMASSITIKEQDNENKLQILNLIIESATDENKIIQHYIERANVLFNMDQWKEVLDNIDYLEEKNVLDDELFMIKWKSMVHYEIQKVRNLMKNELGVKLLDNTEYINFYTNINKENVNELLNKKALKYANAKRKKIM
ncbi:unnamed protein product [Adineta steineri]|uniref:Uncharacterized protein n=1 Tax=Adineta steineri TaxID=433720 RepID=A0A816EQT6_9BILA|nr:unnamed protein product [Adineta steineri]CAF1649180.1 unnamed protein product [Adineta steineri]